MCTEKERALIEAALRWKEAQDNQNSQDSEDLFLSGQELYRVVGELEAERSQMVATDH